MKEKDQYFAYHTSAQGLILCAAQESGLLKEVAEVLCAKAKYAEEGILMGDCIACELLKQITDAFDDHICTPALVWEEFFGEGADVPQCSPEEISPYLNKPALSAIPA